MDRMSPTFDYDDSEYDPKKELAASTTTDFMLARIFAAWFSDELVNVAEWNINEKYEAELMAGLMRALVMYGYSAGAVAASDVDHLVEIIDVMPTVPSFVVAAKDAMALGHTKVYEEPLSRPPPAPQRPQRQDMSTARFKTTNQAWSTPSSTEGLSDTLPLLGTSLAFAGIMTPVTNVVDLCMSISARKREMGPGTTWRQAQQRHFAEDPTAVWRVLSSVVQIGITIMTTPATGGFPTSWLRFVGGLLNTTFGGNAPAFNPYPNAFAVIDQKRRLGKIFGKHWMTNFFDVKTSIVQHFKQEAGTQMDETYLEWLGSITLDIEPTTQSEGLNQWVTYVLENPNWFYGLEVGGAMAAIASVALFALAKKRDSDRGRRQAARAAGAVGAPQIVVQPAPGAVDADNKVSLLRTLRQIRALGGRRTPAAAVDVTARIFRVVDAIETRAEAANGVELAELQRDARTLLGHRQAVGRAPHFVWGDGHEQALTAFEVKYGLRADNAVVVNASAADRSGLVGAVIDAHRARLVQQRLERLALDA